MTMRIVFLICAGALVALGLTASAVSLYQGLVDQAIAFAWPSFGAAMAAGLVWPTVRNSQPA